MYSSPQISLAMVEVNHLASRVGEMYKKGESTETLLIVGFRRSLTQPVERLRWRDRRDSNPKSNDTQSQSGKGIPPLSTEAMTQISDSDRQMLTRIVERWGDLSDELKTY